VVKAVGVDGATGALLVADEREPAGAAERELLAGEVVHVRMDADGPAPAAAAAEAPAAPAAAGEAPAAPAAAGEAPAAPAPGLRV